MSNHQGQLSLSSLRGGQIKYQPAGVHDVWAPLFGCLDDWVLGHLGTKRFSSMLLHCHD